MKLSLQKSGSTVSNQFQAPAQAVSCVLQNCLIVVWNQLWSRSYDDGMIELSNVWFHNPNQQLVSNKGYGCGCLKQDHRRGKVTILVA